MDQTAQIVFGILTAGAGFLISFILYAVWGRLGRLEKADAVMAKEISALHILVAGEYVKRIEIEPKLDAIYMELKEMRKDMSVRRGGHEG